MRLIDGDTLGIGRANPEAFEEKAYAWEWNAAAWGWNAAIDVINAAPTIDAIPVVRCKDCKYSQSPKTPQCMLKEPEVLKCGNIRAACKGRLVYPTDFCSYGAEEEATEDE